MRFWDSSAIVPLVCAESASGQCRAWLRRDPVMLVWAFSETEVLSALARKHREGRLAEKLHRLAERRLRKLQGAWNEIVHYDAVRKQAGLLLKAHPLRAADALQLAAALEARGREAGSFELVTFDSRLGAAARHEGFTVLTA